MMAVINIQRVLTGAEAGDIAITAAEGGINYWAVLDQYKYERWSPDEGNIDVPDDFVFYSIVRGREGAGWYRPPIKVTPALIAEGIRLFLSGVPYTLEEQKRYSKSWGADHPVPVWKFEPRPFADMEEFGAMDAMEADCVIQLGAFGELVFG